MYRGEQIPVGGGKPARAGRSAKPKSILQRSNFLPFRGQYCFGHLSRWMPAGFRRHELPDGTAVAAHEDLPLFVKVEADAYLVLIGLCFDHRNPQHQLSDIGEGLFAVPSSEIIGRTNSLFGRWVAIKSDAEGKVAFSDAGGVLPLIHYFDGNSYICAASSRLIAAHIGDLAPNPAITEEFRALQSTPGRHAGQSFPLRLTEYQDVLALLPNHSLDLRTRQTHRYYFGPVDFGTGKAKDAAPAIGDLVVAIVTAISARYPLAYAATGGFDSRLIAGGVSRVPGLPQKIDFFTFRYPDDSQGAHDDIVLARKVANTIGGTHRVIDAQSDYPDPATSAICRQSEEFYATGFEGWVEKSRVEVEPDRIILMGWASEIARCFFRWPGSDKVNVEQVAQCAGIRHIESFRPEIAAWLASAEQAHKRTGIPVLDLFYWENRVARWCSGGLNILNTGSHWMTIFSCRELLDLMLSVREADRDGSNQTLYRAIIKYLNPAISGIPINPVPLRKRLKKAAVYRIKTILLPVRDAVRRYASAPAAAE